MFFLRHTSMLPENSVRFYVHIRSSFVNTSSSSSCQREREREREREMETALSVGSCVWG